MGGLKPLGKPRPRNLLFEANNLVQSSNIQIWSNINACNKASKLDMGLKFSWYWPDLQNNLVNLTHSEIYSFQGPCVRGQMPALPIPHALNSNNKITNLQVVLTTKAPIPSSSTNILSCINLIMWHSRSLGCPVAARHFCVSEIWSPYLVVNAQ